ncbi:hypothetical protein PK28_01160 [Hymenobacter sp. DG25B]|uniref:T9SS type A sorting domain-containing protein n=1 Tax=Hymenobacter sp. DG25B TaxID=1385664 RepID=UPI0005410162|nr:T9SS type A sorting domain-containing protein [Hymenobacter sp. DG25B]AIZ62633.1 hypothetical protein PK28_01160 [Hymenobacter sp. DG25B]
MKNLYLLFLLAFGVVPLAWGQQPTTPGPGQLLLHTCQPGGAMQLVDIPATFKFPPRTGSGREALPPQVRIIYLIPTDRTYNPTYATAIGNAALHVQSFYQQQMGNTKTFTLREPVVEVYQTPHDAAWYQTNPNGNNFAQFFYNVAQDGFAAVNGMYYDPQNVYVFYIDAEAACGQCGGCGGGGIVVMDSNDFKGLLNLPTTRYCPTDPEPPHYAPCLYVGRLAHEMGHAFGLPHPPGCDDGLPTCDYSDLLYLGYVDYPNTYISQAEKDTLNQSPFFTPQPLKVPPTGCDVLTSARRQAASIMQSISPNPAQGTATVHLRALSRKTTLTLTDALGREVRQYPVGARATEATLDLQGLNPGLYLLRTGASSQRLLVK